MFMFMLKEYSVILTTSFYDMNQKVFKKKIQSFPVVPLQVIHDYVLWHYSTDYCVRLNLIDKTFCKKLLSLHKEIISA